MKYGSFERRIRISSKDQERERVQEREFKRERVQEREVRGGVSPDLPMMSMSLSFLP